MSLVGNQLDHDDMTPTGRGKFRRLTFINVGWQTANEDLARESLAVVGALRMWRWASWWSDLDVVAIEKAGGFFGLVIGALIKGLAWNEKNERRISHGCRTINQFRIYEESSAWGIRETSANASSCCSWIGFPFFRFFLNFFTIFFSLNFRRKFLSNWLITQRTTRLD